MNQQPEYPQQQAYQQPYPQPYGAQQGYWAPQYAAQYPPQPVANPEEDGKALQIVGYVMAGSAIVIPILGLAGLVLGIITATKPRRGAHGAAIICLSLVVGIVGFLVWNEIYSQDTTTY